MLIDIFILFLCIAGSFFFSGTETGFISWNPLKVAYRAGQGNFVARMALYLMNRKERFLTTILIANNICNVGATLMFVNIFVQLDTFVPINLSRIPSPESWFLTPVMLLFGEMLPKTLFRTYPFRMTFKSIPALSAVHFLLLPISFVLSIFAGLSRKSALNDGESYKTKVREEMLLIAGEGARRGNLFEGANRLIDNALRLKDRTVGEITIDLDAWKRTHGCLKRSQSVKDALSFVGEADELVLFNDDCTNPVGIVSLFDIAASKKSLVLENLINEIPSIRSSVSLLSSLQKIKEGTPRFFLVLGNEGAVCGILDRRDLFQAVFGKK